MKRILSDTIAVVETERQSNTPEMASNDFVSEATLESPGSGYAEGCSDQRHQGGCGQGASTPFPELSPACHVARRGQAEFARYAYQYAMTTFPMRVWPAAIVRPSGPTADRDVALLIRYAEGAGLSIALRSGGHQYSGASSTWGDNIQLDLSQAYTDFDWNPETGIVRVGVSWTIDDLSAQLGRLGLFIPHGLCGHVKVGGHAQTGGYGMLVRSFGLLGDHVMALDIFTADGVKRHIRRDRQSADEAELFFATLGGSPGNLGVVTNLYIRPRHDKDYPKSRGLKLMAPYDHELTRKVMQSMVDFCIDDPQGFDYQITVSSSTFCNANRTAPSPSSLPAGTESHSEAVRPRSCDPTSPSRFCTSPLAMPIRTGRTAIRNGSTS